MDEYARFKSECSDEIDELGSNSLLKKLSFDWMSKVSDLKYSYHFEWLGRPIIQFPQDIVAIQEIIWDQKPDLIVETGIAHGGSLVLSASILALLDLCDLEQGISRQAQRKVIGIDIDIREHNRKALELHPLARRIELIQGSSVEKNVIDKVNLEVNKYEKVMVILDSNHTHSHVLEELHLYSKFVSNGQYLVVLDTVIEEFPSGSFNNRSWGKGNNPFTAVTEFLASNTNFRLDDRIENKLLITVAPGGYLQRI